MQVFPSLISTFQKTKITFQIRCGVNGKSIVSLKNYEQPTSRSENFSKIQRNRALKTCFLTIFSRKVHNPVVEMPTPTIIPQGRGITSPPQFLRPWWD